MNSQRRQQRTAAVNRRFSPVAAAQGQPLARADRRCNCSEASRTGQIERNCPVHGVPQAQMSKDKDW